MITSLSQFITFRARPQERRMCRRQLGRSAAADSNIDLVQIQRLLLQTEEDLREASLRPQRNKCGTTTQTDTCVLDSWVRATGPLAVRTPRYRSGLGVGVALSPRPATNCKACRYAEAALCSHCSPTAHNLRPERHT
jgi:hypothetical protein